MVKTSYFHSKSRIYCLIILSIKVHEKYTGVRENALLSFKQDYKSYGLPETREIHIWYWKIKSFYSRLGASGPDKFRALAQSR